MIVHKDLGPNSWYECLVFWWEGVKFKMSLRLLKGAKDD